MNNEKYKDLWEQKEKSFKRVQMDQGIVLFLDCKDVTRDHKKYRLIDRDPIYRHMADSAYHVAQETDLTCLIYSAVDETSVIFQDPMDLIGYFRVGDCLDYILSLYTQRFLKYFWKDYPEIFVKATAFPLPEGEIDRYLAWRKGVCHAVAETYIAKEYLPASKYAGIPFGDDAMKTLLKEEGLYSKLGQNQAFLYGIRKKYETKSFGSMFAEHFL